MPIEHVDVSATPEQVSGVLARDGVVVVDDLVDGSVLDTARSELAPYLDRTPTGPDDISGFNTRRTGGLIARSATARDLIQHRLVLGTVGQLLAHAHNFQLHLTQVIAIGPGETAQMIHRDQ